LTRWRGAAAGGAGPARRPRRGRGRGEGRAPLHPGKRSRTRPSMSTASYLREVWARLCRSVLGAAACALGAAVLDAAWARAAAGRGREGLTIYLADLGLIAPVAVAVGLLAGLAGLLTSPLSPPSPQSLVAALRVRAIGNRAAAAAFVPLLVLGAFAWTTLS